MELGSTNLWRAPEIMVSLVGSVKLIWIHKPVTGSRNHGELIRIHEVCRLQNLSCLDPPLVGESLLFGSGASRVPEFPLCGSVGLQNSSVGLRYRNTARRAPDSYLDPAGSRTSGSEQELGGDSLSIWSLFEHFEFFFILLAVKQNVSLLIQRSMSLRLNFMHQLCVFWTRILILTCLCIYVEEISLQSICSCSTAIVPTSGIILFLTHEWIQKRDWYACICVRFILC